MEEGTLSLQSRLERDHWWYAARRTIVRSLLGSVQPGALILDAGSGPGGNRAILPGDTRCLAMDPAAHSLRLSADHPYWGSVQGDLLHLPFVSDCFDMVVAMDVLEHLDDDAGAVREIHRVLRPGGRLLITVPAFRWLWGLQDRLSHHKRRYTRAGLLRVLRGSDLEVCRATYFNLFLLPPIWLGRKLLDLLPHRLQSEGQITAPGVNALLRWIFGSPVTISDETQK